MLLSMTATKVILPLFLAGLVVSQVPQQCGLTTSYISKPTMQFTPSMPTQTPPISTVYGAIMTEYLNVGVQVAMKIAPLIARQVVDCEYVMVENIDNNPPQMVSVCSTVDGGPSQLTGHQGRFTDKTTVPFLTVYRVGCMPVTTAVTRRELRGYDMVDSSQPLTEMGPLVGQHKHKYDKRNSLQTSAMDSIYTIAERLAQGIDPTNVNITVGAYRFLEQINTALFAINIVNSGIPLDVMCEALRNATVQVKLTDSSIEPSQASNLVCWAERYGLYFGMSNAQLLADLAALEYVVQVKAVGKQDLQELCQKLDYTAASFLGIDVQGIRTYACNSTGGILPTSTPLGTAVPGSNSTTVAISATTDMPMRTSGTAITPTGTEPTPPTVVHGTDGSMLSSATSAAGSVGPWLNTTTSSMTMERSTTVDMEPTATDTEEASAGASPTQSKARQPMSPLSIMFYPPLHGRDE